MEKKLLRLLGVSMLMSQRFAPFEITKKRLNFKRLCDSAVQIYEELYRDILRRSKQIFINGKVRALFVLLARSEPNYRQAVRKRSKRKKKRSIQRDAIETTFGGSKNQSTRYDANYTNEDGLTHFHLACEYGCDDAVRKFLELGQDPNVLLTKTGDSPLRFAIEKRNKVVVELLLRHGAIPSLANKDGLNALHIVSKSGYDDSGLVRMLFDISEEMNRPLAVDATDKSGNTSLHLALAAGYAEVSKELLRRGANPNSANEDGLNALHIVCKKFNNVDIVRSLFDFSHEKYRPVEINAQDKLGNAPLHYVVGFVLQRKVMEFLLIKGADPNLANEEGSTPLHSICKVYWNDDDLTKIFLEVNKELDQTVQIDALDKEGRTPLQLAVANFLPHTVNVLLDRGANLSGFVFPSESYFAESIIPKTQYPLSTSITIKVAAGALAIAESLEKRGYQLGRSDIMTIMNFFDKLKMIKNLVDTDKSWCDDEEFAKKAKDIMINSSGSQRFDDDNDDDDEDDEDCSRQRKEEMKSLSLIKYI
ncbi:unnamed protein product [Trichogramma brassicae]|uniref:Uncharacterized protein n=1 Tax=Trichogramma brassicae TaxID=86971 RepID=A0A6H5IZN0_9HYME|nr:unnamed protein product [Trichogramma brassicae]